MPEEKPSLPWTSSMLLRDKEEPSMVSEVDLQINCYSYCYSCLLNTL
jgi:hypothetical protein